jgi:SAM-dependent methyltransferase
MDCLNDLLVYAVDPSIYDRLPFTTWDDRELTALADFTGKRVVDVGAGTGRLSLAAARAGASVVYAVEPVGNLRDYLREKARREGFCNIFPLDGLITAIPFEAGFADLVISGHVFGDHPVEEERELSRICRPGGMVILHPGWVDSDDEPHVYLVERGYTWARFMEPGSGWKRKYWKKLE